jgi:hypothetical protein
MPLSSDSISRDRPRFTRFRLARLADGRCRARVALQWEHRGRFVGEAEAMGAASGELRCAAQACLNALAQGVPEHAFDILGVKAIRAFDANVVLVSLAVRGSPSAPRLVGSCLAGDNLPRAAAIAVLHATNRIVTKADSPAVETLRPSAVPPLRLVQP